jgi:hypothetical protein
MPPFRIVHGVCAIVVAAGLVAACSGDKPPPATASSTPDPSATAAPSASSAAPSGPSAAADPSAPAASSSAAPAGGGDKSTGAPSSSSDDDDCNAVAVDFEQRARPKFKECYREGKKKEPDLKGDVKIKIAVDLKGKITSTKVIEKTLPAPVVDCILKGVKATPFPEVKKCWDRSITLPIAFPTHS